MDIVVVEHCILMWHIYMHMTYIILYIQLMNNYVQINLFNCVLFPIHQCEVICIQRHKHIILNSIVNCKRRIVLTNRHEEWGPQVVFEPHQTHLSLQVVVVSSPSVLSTGEVT